VVVVGLCVFVVVVVLGLVRGLFWVRGDDALRRGFVAIGLAHSGGVVGRCFLCFVEVAVATEAIRVWYTVEVAVVAGHDVFVEARDRHAFEEWEDAAFATEVVVDCE